MYASRGGLHLNSIDLFFPGKPTETHGETWEYLGSPKIFCAEDPVSLRFWIFLETNTCKHMQTRSSTHRSHSEDMTLFSEMYALQGVPMTTLARSIPSIFQKWCAFRLPNPLKIHFSKKGIPQKKLNIPGDPGKTKPVKCIKPPPQNKRSCGGLDIPTHGSYI